VIGGPSICEPGLTRISQTDAPAIARDITHAVTLSPRTPVVSTENVEVGNYHYGSLTILLSKLNNAERALY
jgi:hypothetical protein